MTTMHGRRYSTYIVASRSHTLYIGVTGNLHKRIFEHKWREHDGFTQRYHCDRMIVDNGSDVFHSAPFRGLNQLFELTHSFTSRLR